LKSLSSSISSSIQAAASATAAAAQAATPAGEKDFFSTMLGGFSTPTSATMPTEASIKPVSSPEPKKALPRNPLHSPAKSAISPAAQSTPLAINTKPLSSNTSPKSSSESNREHQPLSPSKSPTRKSESEPLSNEMKSLKAGAMLDELVDMAANRSPKRSDSVSLQGSQPHPSKVSEPPAAVQKPELKSTSKPRSRTPSPDRQIPLKKQDSEVNVPAGEGISENVSTAAVVDVETNKNLATASENQQIVPSDAEPTFGEPPSEPQSTGNNDEKVNESGDLVASESIKTVDSEVASTAEKDHLRELQKLKKVIEQREKQLMAVMTENAELLETSNSLRSQLTNLEQLQVDESSNTDSVVADLNVRLDDAKKNLASVTKERDQLQKQINTLQQALDESVKHVQSREERIKDLLIEGLFSQLVSQVGIFTFA
jgi:hypothetical protein